MSSKHAVTPVGVRVFQDDAQANRACQCFIVFTVCMAFVMLSFMSVAIATNYKSCQQQESTGTVVISAGWQHGVFNCTSAPCSPAVPLIFYNTALPLISSNGYLIAESKAQFMLGHFDLSCGDVLGPNDTWWSGTGASCDTVESVGSIQMLQLYNASCNSSHVVLCICI